MVRYRDTATAVMKLSSSWSASPGRSLVVGDDRRRNLVGPLELALTKGSCLIKSSRPPFKKVPYSRTHCSRERRRASS
jgi:hypothetical protein